MKKQLFGCFLIAFILISIIGMAQNKNFPIKKLNGIDYYQYTVQVSEGLFAIGRKFEVSPEEISKVNPEIKNGLKVGQKILIPVQKNAPKETFSEVDSKPEFIEHKVEKKQTLFAISHKYNVNQEDIKKYNPDIVNGLRDGMMLKIPKQTTDNKKKEVEQTIVEKHDKNTIKETKKNTIIHVVQADETLYSISRRYKVEVSDVIALNPSSATKLFIGTELKIPANSGIVASVSQRKDIVENPKKQDYDINKLIDTKTLSKSTEKSKTIRIAFLLPFMLDQDKKDASVDRFVDFYAGALLAIQEAKQKGISFEIHCFDTEKSEDKLVEVLSNSELKTMDLIIGPAFSNQVSMISEFSKTNRINTLIPFTSKVSDIDSNPYLFQFNPGNDTQLNFASELFSGKYKNMHIVFAQIPGVSSMDEGKIFADELKKELKKSNKSFSILELTTSDAADFKSMIKTGEKNLIIFNTDKFAYVSPFLSTLRSSGTYSDIVLFKQYSWKNQTEKMPKGLYISPFVRTSNQEKLNEFNSEFTHFFGKTSGKDSPRFDLLGYDLTGYFISLYNRYGNKFVDKVGSYNFSNGLQSQPLFERTSNGSGFINQRIYLGED